MINLENVDQWKINKFGKFSASEIWKLTIGGREDKKTGAKAMFGETALSYIKKIACQSFTIFNEDDQVETYSMKLGKMREGDSAAHYQKMIGIEMVYYGGSNPLFHHYCAEAGCSPDIVVWKDEEAKIASFGAELKNPSSAVHMEYLLSIKDATDLKKESIEYYAQCQFAMMTFKTNLWHWVSHNEYFRGNDRMLIIEIPADKTFQDELDIRLSMAVKKKNEFIELLKNR